MIRAGSIGKAEFAERPSQQVGAILKLAYGPDFPLARGRRMFLLHLAARSLKGEKLDRASAATRALGLPESTWSIPA